MSDYLTDEEQLARFKSWWDENGTSTIVGLVLVIVGLVGWRWYGSHQAQVVGQASELYTEFVASQGAERETLAAQLAAEAPDTAYYALALMYLARDAVASGDYEGAEQHLHAAIAAAPEPELADIARLRLARLQQQGDRSDAALQTLGAIRSGGFRSHVAELKGDIHVARGERRLAHESYSAALADEANAGRRPVLEMKVADNADAALAQLDDTSAAEISPPKGVDADSEPVGAEVDEDFVENVGAEVIDSEAPAPDVPPDA